MPIIDRISRAFLAAALIGCAGGLLAGCGGAEETAAAPRNASQSSAGTMDQQYDEWEQKYRNCLGDKGFELPKEPGKIDFGDRQDAFKVAEDGCLDQIGMPPTAADNKNPENQKKMQEVALKNAKCLRDRGYEVADPKVGTPLSVPPGVTQKDIDECLA